MIFFTADEHYHHKNIIRFQNRPFDNIIQMNERLIENNNAIVRQDDTVYHLGDFCFGGKQQVNKIVDRLTGNHIFIRGSHDSWLRNDKMIIEISIENQDITLCHYAMRTWRKSHFGSWQLHGHSHGNLPPEGKQLDVGVDTHDFTPVSWEMVKQLMKARGENTHTTSRGNYE